MRSVGVISTGGSTFCTGSLLNNTAADRRMYFITANHCGITSANDADRHPGRLEAAPRQPRQPALPVVPIDVLSDSRPG